MKGQETWFDPQTLGHLTLDPIDCHGITRLTPVDILTAKYGVDIKQAASKLAVE